MAARFDRKIIPPVSQKRVSRSSETLKGAEKQKSSSMSKDTIIELLAKEEEYKMRNAAIEAKAAGLVSQADQLLGEVLSNSSSNFLDSKGEKASRTTNSQENTTQDEFFEVACRIQHPPSPNRHSQKGPKQNASLSQKSGKTSDKSKEKSTETFLSKAIQSIEEKMTDDCGTEENCAGDAVDVDEEDEVISVALTRVAKARLRIMQEELDQLSSEYYKKVGYKKNVVSRGSQSFKNTGKCVLLQDDETIKLSEKLKHLEDDRVRHEKTITSLKAQIDKHKALGEDSGKKCISLQTELSSVRKELENQKRSHKQVVAAQSTAEVRLTRALEEVEKLKTQLATSKQSNKDLIKEENSKRESLLAENNMLQKQKSELIMGFKKQLKLIDILKKQKMHFEAAKLLSFSEEEFVKALDWASGE